MTRTLLLLASLLPLYAFAQEGSLDPAFGTSGIATLPVSYGATMMVARPDGRVLLCGDGLVGGYFGARVIGLTASGAVDASFGSAGSVTSTFFGDDETPFAMALQTDGKVVVVGDVRMASATPFHFGIMRFTAAGQADNTFGSAGNVNLPIGTENAKAYAVAIRDDGRILVAGRYGNSLTDVAVVCLNTDGTLYTGFGDAGIRMIDVSDYDMPVSMAVRADGTVLIAVQCYDTAYHTGIVRLLPNGNLDIAFSGDGKLILPSSGDPVVQRMALRPGGGFIVAGAGNIIDASDHITVGAFNDDGSGVASFGTSGLVSNNVTGSSVSAFAMLVQADGRIVVAGDVLTGADHDHLVMRFNANGTVDAGFGTGGVSIIGTPSTDQFAYALANAADGGILVGGTEGSLGNGSPQALELLSGATSGIEEDNMENTFIHTYPNPAARSLTISCEHSSPNAMVSVLDASGRVVIAPRSLKQVPTVDVSTLANGSYTVLISDGGSIRNTRFIKN